jgi:chromosome segregation ATPase
MSEKLARLQQAQALQSQMQAQITAAHAELAAQLDMFRAAQAQLAGLDRELGEIGAVVGQIRQAAAPAQAALHELQVSRSDPAGRRPRAGGPARAPGESV